MLIGYARASTTDQYLNMQEDALRVRAAKDVYTDVVSGVKTFVLSCILHYHIYEKAICWLYGDSIS